MRFLPYLAILIVGAGTLLLGVDLMTLPQKPAAQLAGAPNKLAQHEADQRAEKTEGDASRTLTPLYPANPGGAKDVRMVYPPNIQLSDQPNNQPSDQTAATTATTGAAPADEGKADVAVTADAPPQQAAELRQPNAGVPLPPQKLQPAKAEEQPAPKPVQPVADHVANHCDVQACTNAYASFRASDCTYQPFEGARRVCTTPPAQRSAEREALPRNILPRQALPARAAQAQRQADPRTEQPMTAGYADDDVDAPTGNGQRMIVIERGVRPWR